MEQACHAGGRGFESRRSRLEKCLQIATTSCPTRRKDALRGPIVARCLSSKRPANSNFATWACSRSHEQERVINGAQALVRRLVRRTSLSRQPSQGSSSWCAFLWSSAPVEDGRRYATDSRACVMRSSRLVAAAASRAAASCSGGSSKSRASSPVAPRNCNRAAAARDRVRR